MPPKRGRPKKVQNASNNDEPIIKKPKAEEPDTELPDINGEEGTVSPEPAVEDEGSGEGAPKPKGRGRAPQNKKNIDDMEIEDNGSDISDPPAPKRGRKKPTPKQATTPALTPPDTTATGTRPKRKAAQVKQGQYNDYETGNETGNETRDSETPEKKTRKPRKAAKAKLDDEDETDSKQDETDSKQDETVKKTRKPRGKAVKMNLAEDEDETDSKQDETPNETAKKTRKPRGKAAQAKVKLEEDEDEADLKLEDETEKKTTKPQPKRKAAQSKVKLEDDEDETDSKLANGDSETPNETEKKTTKPQPKRKAAQSKAKLVNGDADNSETKLDENEETQNNKNETQERKGRKPRGKASQKVKQEIKEEEEEEEEEETGKAKGGRGKKVKKEEKDETVKPASKGKNSKSKKSGEETKPKTGVDRVVVMKGRAAVDALCPIASHSHVFEDDEEVWDCMLNQTNIQFNNNKYYLIQLLRDDTKPVYSVWMRWGRVGANGQNSLHPCGADVNKAMNIFMKKFSDKTKNDWYEKDIFEKVPGKYDLIKMDYSKGKDTTDSVETVKKSNEERKKIECKLEVRVRAVIEMICNIKAMEEAVVEMKYDAKKAPLGKLTSEQIKAGYLALKKISEIVMSDKMKNNDLVQACNDFYTRIPHYFGMKVPPLIRTQDEVREKIKLLEALGDIQAALSVLDQPIDVNIHPVDQKYMSLKCDLKPLEKLDPDFKVIEQYLQTTHAKTHNQYSLELLDVFACYKESEHTRFKDMGERHLLWHGSRMSNMAGILSTGLRIAPPEAPVTGYMFGKGIYFADMASKSANYCWATRNSNIGFLLLSEVSLGTIHELYHADYNADKLPNGYSSVKGCGRTAPHKQNYTKLSDGTIVPMGPGQNVKGNNTSGYSLLYNEYIVYDPAQDIEVIAVQIPNDDSCEIRLPNFIWNGSKENLEQEIENKFINFGPIYRISVFKTTDRDQKFILNEDDNIWFAFVHFYSKEDFNKALEKKEIEIGDSKILIKRKRKRKIADLEDLKLPLNKAQDLMAFYFGFNSWKSEIIHIERDANTENPNILRFVCLVRICLWKEGLYSDGVGIGEAPLISDYNSATSKGTSYACAQKFAHNSAMKTAFSKFLIIKLGNGKISAEVDTSQCDPFLYDTALDHPVIKVNEISCDPEEDDDGFELLEDIDEEELNNILDCTTTH